MNRPYYEVFKEVNENGIRLAHNTVPGGHRPLHWHDALEILFPLNGDATIVIEGKKYKLLNHQILVVESGKVHGTTTHSDMHMFICIQISKKLMQKYMPDIELYHIHCIPEELTKEQIPHYLQLTELLEELTRIYIENPLAYILEAEGIILQVLAKLIRHFSTTAIPASGGNANILAMNRLKDIISYVDEHYTEAITLQEMADLIGVGKEYFCRFFKNNIGMSFLQYLNEVRISHIYQDIQNTDLPISEIMEKNGLYNQKLFNKTFKEMYGATPSAIRKNVV